MSLPRVDLRVSLVFVLSAETVWSNEVQISQKSQISKNQAKHQKPKTQITPFCEVSLKTHIRRAQKIEV